MDNERLVFDAGNSWGEDVKLSPFFTIPSWCRRFMFKLLTPRNFCVYAYVVSVADRHGIAYPAPEQIASDLGVKSRVIVNRALDEIVNLGFLMRTEERLKIRRGMKRVVFQRPAASYTLLTLIRANLIGGDLFPVDTSEDARDLDFTGSAVDAGLKNLLGRDGFRRYQASKDKKATLQELLEADLERRRAA